MFKCCYSYTVLWRSFVGTTDECRPIRPLAVDKVNSEAETVNHVFFWYYDYQEYLTYNMREREESIDSVNWCVFYESSDFYFLCFWKNRLWMSVKTWKCVICTSFLVRANSFRSDHESFPILLQIKVTSNTSFGFISTHKISNCTKDSISVCSCHKNFPRFEKKLINFAFSSLQEFDFDSCHFYTN